MSNKYSAEFKEQALKRVLAEESSTQMARDLGINVNSLYLAISDSLQRRHLLFLGIQLPPLDFCSLFAVVGFQHLLPEGIRFL